MTYDSDDTTFMENEFGPGGEFIPRVIRLARTIRYRKKIVFSTMYIACLVGAIYYLFGTRYYASTAKLLIVEQKQDQLSSVSDQDTSGNTMATHREIVRSPVVIQNAIQSLSDNQRVDLKGIPPHKWVDTISKRLSTGVTRKTNLIDVSYQSQHPEAAAAVVRAIIHSYLSFVDKTHKGTASEFVEVLKTGYSQRQAELDAKQKQLQTYRRQIGHLAVTTNDKAVQPLMQRMASLNEAWTEAQVERLGFQAVHASVKEGLERGESINQHLMSIQASIGEQMMLASMGLSSQDLRLVTEQQKLLFETRDEYNKLSSSYGANHPHLIDLKNRIAGIEGFLRDYRSSAGERFNSMEEVVSKSTVLNMLARAVRESEQKEQQLFVALQQARTEAAQQSDHVVQLQIMEHEVERLETYLDSLSEKIDTFDISQVHAPIKATVVREPLPGQRPVSPQLRLVVLTCFFGGSLLGVLIAYVQDVLDDRFNTPEEISTQLGVPILSIIRKLDLLPGEGLASIHTHAMPNSVESEPFRTLRTALTLKGDACDRILISSSEPGDGKTTITANLAVTLAQAGNRTLVIDADLRRPGFTTLTNLKGKPGVTDILASDTPPEITAPPLVQGSEVKNLDFLPVGLRRPNPAELLSGKAFVELLAWADSQYDRVIVDCPPVLAVSDAQIVGQVVDGAVLVVRPEKNHRRSVIRAVESFQATGCRMLGIVANAVSNESPTYGYGYEYGYGNEYGHSDSEQHSFEATDEHPAEERFEQEEFPAVVSGMSEHHLPETPATPIQPRRAA